MNRRISPSARCITVLTFACLVCFALWSVRGRAATNIIVNTTNDNAANDGQCTLREAITAANNDAASGGAAGECAAGSGADDTISFSVTGIINLTSALPAITAGVTVNGPGANVLTVQRSSGATNFRIFDVNAPTPNVVTFSGLTVRAGFATDGGGIRNNSTGTLNVTSSTLSGNTAVQIGGGISSNGTLTVTNSSVSGNTAGNQGGGIYKNGGTLTVTNSTLSGNSATDGGGTYSIGGTVAVTNTTVSGNRASGHGGGIYNNGTFTVTRSTLSSNSANLFGGGIYNNGTLTVTNSTLSGNSAPQIGGGVYNQGTVNLTGSTLTGNSADDGGGIYNLNPGVVTVRNSIVALNTAFNLGPDDLFGRMTTQGFNIFGSTSGANAAGGGAFVPAPTDQTGVSAAQLQIGPLASNGGPTQTHRLLAGSVAIDKGNDFSASPTIDQRGALRPFNDPSIPPATGGDDSDIGAFEFQSTAEQTAPSYVVNTPDDHDDGANGCTTGDCTLREAITAANASAGTDTITFNILGDGPHTIQLTGALPGLSSVDILNTSGEGVTVRRNTDASYSIFFINFGQTVNLSGLTITNGRGGIYNDRGTLTVTNCTVSGNSNPSGSGGGIYNEGTLTVTNSTVSGNSANSGGGILDFGMLTVTNSTISGNTASSNGGGIFYGRFPGTLTGVTLTDNRADSDNDGSGTGGGIFTSGGPSLQPLLRSTIVAGNFNEDGATDTADDIKNANASLDAASSYNLIGTGGSGGLTNGTNNNQVGVANPGLAPLADNGGPTQTHALLTGSPALNAGSDALAVDQDGNPLTTDQRGAGFPRIVGASVDIGAFEFNSTPPNTPTGNNVTAQVSSGDARATFAQVTVAGNSTFTPIIPPSSAGTPPAGYTILNDAPAYDITTTATYTPPVTVCFTVSSINDAATFARVRILHGENGQLVDRTILAPDAPAPDFATRSVCARVNSLSPFVTSLAPAATPTPTPTTTPSCTFISQQATLTRQDAGVATAGPTTVQAGSVEFNSIPGDGRFSVDVEGTSVRMFNNTGSTDVQFNSPNTITISVSGSQPITGINSVTINGVTNFTPQNVSFTSNSVTFNVANSVWNAGTSVVVGLQLDCPTATPTPTPTPTPNTPPNTVNDAYSVNEDSTLNTPAPGVLGNDTDAQNNSLTAQLQTSPANAAAFALNANGSFSYTPNANFNGTDSFTYTASDGNLASNAATVTITVNAVNDNPAAAGDSATVAEDSGATTVNVLGNDSALPDTGETLTVTAVTQGANGAVAITGGGTNVSYTPNANYNGADSFTYTVSDGNGGTDTATVNVTVTSVNDNPDAADDSATVNEDSGATTVNVLSNDDDAPDTGETLTVSSVTQGTSGTIAITGGGADLSYTPNANFNGTDSFTYTASDGNGGTDTATVNVTVTAVNDAPRIDAIADKATDEGVVLTFMAAGNDDADNPPNSFSFSLDGAPAGAAITAAGAFSWTPTEAQGPGQFTFRVRVTDTGTPALHADEEITVTVREVNAAPVLGAIGNGSGFWGNALNFTATATDSDLPANTLTYTLAGAPAGASITAAGVFAWTPTSAQLGTHTFTVLVTDNGSPSLSDSETIAITIGERPTVLVYSGAAAGQYSDSVALTATLADNGGGTMQGTLLAGKAISFTLGSQGASEVSNAAGVAGKSLTLTQMAQSLNIVSQFGGDALYQSSGDSDSFTINKEDVETTYTGDSLIFTAGPSIGTASSVRLSARLTQLDSELGNLTLARVRFELYKFSNSSTTPTLTFANIAVDAAGNAETTVALAVDDVYTVRVVIEAANNYWTANPAGEGTLVVAYGTTERRVTGGGWVPDAASANNKGNFGFTVNYQKSGSPKGNSLYLFRGTDGYNYRLKSNSWQGGGLTFYGEPWKAAFSGKCNVQKIDPVTGATVQSWGSYTFTVDLVDGDLKNPRETDRYAIQVLTDAGALWKQIGTRTAPVQLGGGNVAVKSK